MTTDRLFVIMLVMLIPMTGCFGAVDNADAEENTSETIVNNYYNNTTTIVEAPVIEKFTAGGVIDFNSSSYYSINPDYRYYNPYSFTTIAGELVTVHYLQENNVNNVNLVTVCDDGTTYQSIHTLDEERPVWGSYTNCVHTMEIVSSYLGGPYLEDYESGEMVMSWSLVYSIESVTVV